MFKVDSAYFLSPVCMFYFCTYACQNAYLVENRFTLQQSVISLFFHGLTFTVWCIIMDVYFFQCLWPEQQLDTAVFVWFIRHLMHLICTGFFWSMLKLQSVSTHHWIIYTFVYPRGIVLEGSFILSFTLPLGKLYSVIAWLPQRTAY